MAVYLLPYYDASISLWIPTSGQVHDVDRGESGCNDIQLYTQGTSALV